MASIIGDYSANESKIASLFAEFYARFKNCKPEKKILDLKQNKTPQDATQNNLAQGYIGVDDLNLIYTASLPDIVFLPEVWTLGWAPECFQKNVKKNEAALEFLSSIAKKYKVNIIGGSYIRETKDGYKNSCPIINRNGEVVAFYDKIHLYSPDGEAKAVTAGNTPLIVDIEGLKIGLSICYDIRFPELFRSYIAYSGNHKDAPYMNVLSNGQSKLQDSEIIPDLLVNLSAWPKTRRAQYDAMAKSRAIENQSYFLALSQTGLIKDGIYNSGYSELVHPLGETIAMLNEDEDFIFETIDTTIVKNIRKTFPNLSNRRVDNFGFHPQYVKIEAL